MFKLLIITRIGGTAIAQTVVDFDDLMARDQATFNIQAHQNDCRHIEITTVKL